jgi:HTH-type transcriptional regulator, sugar sensing transcriptional regulator
MNFEETLKKIGLNPKEVEIYLTLLDQGEQKISSLLEKTKLKRGDLYYALDNLVTKKLIVREDKKKKLHFKLAHPNNLQTLVEEKEAAIKNIELEISAMLPAIISNYNLSYDQPGVKVFEGTEGIRAVMNDTLNAKTDILAILTPREIDKYVSEANKNYLKQRYAAGIKKKILVADNQYNRDHYQGRSDELTEIRYIKGGLITSGTVLEIYDNKVSYTIIKPSSAIGLIVDDAHIASMQRSLFMIYWNIAEKLVN